MGNFSDFFAASSGNNILEMISCVPDGRSITAPSGTYTLQSNTNRQEFASTYGDLRGSTITNYTPPEGTKYLKYEYTFQMSGRNSSQNYYGISHFRLYVGSDEIVEAFKTYAGQYYSVYGYNVQQFSVGYVFDLTASTNDVSKGKFSDWTDARTIKIQARKYNNNYTSTAHANIWRDGTGTSGVFNQTKPLLTLIAYS